MTGLPFVWAVWAGRTGAASPDVCRLLYDTRLRGVAAIDAIARRERARRSGGAGADRQLSARHDHLRPRRAAARRRAGVFRWAGGGAADPAGAAAAHVCGRRPARAGATIGGGQGGRVQGAHGRRARTDRGQSRCRGARGRRRGAPPLPRGADLLLGRAADAVAGALHPEPSAPTTSTATSTTPTSAPRSATSAPSTARSDTPKPTSSPRRVCREDPRDRRARRRPDPDAGRPPPRPASSSGTRSCSATSRRTSPRFNIHGFSARRSHFSQGVEAAAAATVLERLEAARAWAASRAAAPRSWSIASASAHRAARC